MTSALQFRMVPALLVLALSGCATAYKAQMPDLSARCVEKLDAVVPRPLVYLPSEDRERKAAMKPVEFASLATCYQPADAKPLPVALYRLEEIAGPSEISVAVTLSTGGTLAAKVDLLDDNFASLRSFHFDNFVRRGSLYSLSVFLNDASALPRYLLISPDRNQVGKTDTAVGAQSNVIAFPAGGAYVYGTETNVSRPMVEGGLLQVYLQPQASVGTDGETR